jgi:threonine/homoserine/homoserine lactone efflux protein
MFDLASIVTYVAVVIGLFLIPGPAVLLVITRTVQGGRNVGIATAEKSRKKQKKGDGFIILKI